jgi:hypothetical protein
VPADNGPPNGARAAVAHQMRRPKLARLLDLEESRLPIRSRNRPASDAIHGALSRLLRRPDVAYSFNIKEAAFGLLAIAKGMVDALLYVEKRMRTNREKSAARSLWLS